MTQVKAFPDDETFNLAPGERLLTGALRANISLAHACGSRAKCSTCRIWIKEGLDHCPPRTPAEMHMAEQLGFDHHVRLACQLTPSGPITFRRLVLDETDLVVCNQLDREAACRVGELLPVTVLFSDVSGFSSISEGLPAYDVMYLLNRYFVQTGEIIERNGGYIDKFIGDGMMAIFGTDSHPEAPLRAVQAACRRWMLSTE